jgi:hypothetical protein
MRIVAAAINHNGKIWTGPNHQQILRQIWIAENVEVPYTVPEEEGFVTDTDQFLDRFQAGSVAFISGQTSVKHEVLLSSHLGLSQDF